MPQTKTLVSRLAEFNALPLLLLLSGFAGISYEVLYGRLLGNLIGDQFAVSASVLITFLLGSGLGSAWAYRLWRWLWLIEAGIGACGVAFALGYEGLQALLYSGQISGASGMAVQVGTGVALLLLPAFLVGCSVPLFAGYLATSGRDAGFARVYSIYNLGAGTTALALEFLVLRLFGISGAMLCFATLNFVVAGWLRWRYTDPQPTPAEQAEPLDVPADTLAALALASAASAIFQLFMVKLSEFMFGPFRETFALVLAIVLFGIAAGTALVKRYRIGFTGLMLANLAGLALLLVLVQPAVYGYSLSYEHLTDFKGAALSLKALLLLLLMALPALSFGATVPALLTEARQVARDSGRLLFVAALANSAGFLLMVFAIHPYLDYGVQVLLIAGLSGAALLIYRGLGTREIEATVAIAALLFAAHRWLWDETLLYMNYVTFQSYPELRHTRASFRVTDAFRGHQDIFSVTWIGDKPYFFINGYVSFPLNSASEQVVGLISSMFAPRADDALVLGLGSGSTASVVGMAFDRTDAVEINPAVTANLGKLGRWNHDILKNPKVNIVLDDAIHYVRTPGKTYSLILNTVTSPLYFSSSKLYTQDFFQAVKSRLRQDGIYATWVDSRVGDSGINIILKTLSASFQECSIFYIKATYFLIVCGDQPVTLRQTGLAAKAPEVWRELTHEHDILPDWLPYNLLSGKALSLIDDPYATPVNTLDYPALEFEIAQLKHKGIPGFKATLQSRVRPEEVEPNLAALGAWKPARLAEEAEQRLDDDNYIARRWRALGGASQNHYTQDLAAAKLDYWQALAEQAGTAKAHHKYGYQLLKAGRHAEAIAQFQKALAANPRYDNAHFNLGSAYEAQNQHALALDQYQRELAVDPEDQEALHRIGRSYVELGEYEKGLFYLTTARYQGGALGDLYRARALDGLGKREEAMALYRDLLARKSVDEDIVEAARKRLAGS